MEYYRKFIHRASSAKAAVKRALGYTWGGDTEQQMLAQMKEDALSLIIAVTF
jgi:hypothetical protein